ncbi:DUF1801 domain-containing protein [Massilia sp. CCM 8733]|uniref:DUF1801 domain-containing protein n=1 Tax=Massilia mucilaginosa TaxID=2609282 RepID=A0ABX0NUW5_9BURK|nr:DUF1801 domain-containing protein [Massilia mucilaginosa]NHZ90529.1 DUF1801 domain-containing protein [Massilia mucilaginosa]
MTPPITPFSNAAVQRTYASYPAPIRERLLVLRELIFATAASTEGVGPIEETLKWGEPAYLTTRSKSGSTIRLAWKKSEPAQYAIYFNCKTTLLDTFRSIFPHDFVFEGNRALVFEQSATPPADALAYCIASALTYHRS